MADPIKIELASLVWFGMEEEEEEEEEKRRRRR
jgi:hypothetical protein